MKKINEIIMIVSFVLSGLSAMMCYGEGFRMWIWQVLVMIWVGNCYFLEKKLNKKQ
jgi:hypothetical protein